MEAALENATLSLVPWCLQSVFNKANVMSPKIILNINSNI
jgi:hypothetical protein